MTTEQTWELLEIHRLLIDTDEHKKSIGVSLLVDFIETHLFTADVIGWVSCVKCGCAIQKDIAEEELYMCVECSNAYYTHDEEEEIECDECGCIHDKENEELSVKEDN